MAHQFLFSPYILDNLSIPSNGFDVVQDSVQPLLKMYITSRGVKSFFIRKRINGKDKRIILGKYPDLDIDKARILAEKTVKLSIKKKRISNKKILFLKVIDLYLLSKVHRNQDSMKKLTCSIKNHLSSFFEKSVRDISKDDIEFLLNNISGASIRNRLLELLNSIFNFSIEKGYLIENPATNIKKITEQRRVRPLTKAGLRRLIIVINKEKNQTIKVAFLMLVYSFLTKSKIFSMKWSELDFNKYTWNNYPLSDKACILLQDLPQTGIWVFSGRKGHLTDPRSVWKQIVSKAKIPNLTMDDVHKFLSRQLVWSSNIEILRSNMNRLINDL